MYLQIAIKLAVAFVCLLAFINLSGRVQLAPQSAVDQIGNYVLGGIVGGMLYNTAVSALELVYVIAIWAALVIFTRMLRFRSGKARSLIDGNSVMLLNDGEILSDNLLSVKLHLNTFIAALHERGYHSLSELQTVWLETNGQYTVLKRGERGYALSLVEGGKIVPDKLRLSGKTEAWLTQALKEKGYAQVSDVLYAELYDSGEGMVLAAFPYQNGTRR